jgi:hypothetical protein
MRLAEVTAPGKQHTFMPFYESPGEFRSTISNGRFRLKRAIDSSALISLHGRFIPTATGCRLEAAVSIGGSLVLSSLAFVLAVVLIVTIISDSWNASGRIAGGAAFAVGTVAIIYLFVYLMGRAERSNVPRFFYLVYLGRPRA